MYKYLFTLPFQSYLKPSSPTSTSLILHLSFISVSSAGMMLESEEVDMRRPGEQPTVFVPGGELAMRPSNMGIQPAVSEPSPDPATITAASTDDDNQPANRLRRLNVEGDSVPGSQRFGPCGTCRPSPQPARASKRDGADRSRPTARAP